jgi:type II secretory pathway component PulJ
MRRRYLGFSLLELFEIIIAVCIIAIIGIAFFALLHILFEVIEFRF